MKQLVLFISLLVLSIASVSAESDAGPSTRLTEEQRAEMAQRIEEATAALNLTEEQKLRFAEISKEYGSEMMEIRDSKHGKMQKARQLRKLTSERNGEMKKLLSAEQFATYKELQEQAQARMKEQRSAQ